MSEPGFLDAIRATGADVDGPVLSDRGREEAGRIVARYPTPRSALIPLLYLVQSEVGWVPPQGIREVAGLLGITSAEVESVATFYTMLKLHPCGRFVMSICTNPSCALAGARGLLDRARAVLGEDSERVTDDGLFTVEEEECLAACDLAPVVTLNYVYYDRVTEDGLDGMIASIRAGEVPEASRGGVPGDLREVSRVLAGLGARSGAGAGDG